MAVLMVVLQFGSGLLLSFFYEPLPVRAYESVQHIQESVFLGQLVRNLHHWIGHVLVIVVFLHMLRVFLSGAFYPPRHRNWLVGLGLGLLILLANFSGYLLPWDQLSYWAVTIAGGMLAYVPFIGISLQKIIIGGGEVGTATLQLFYAIHTTGVPVVLFLLMSYHFWFVRKAGGVLLPVRDQGFDRKKTTVPLAELLVREFSFAALLSCVLLLFAMFVDAPLGDMANSQLTPQNVKAPWYFLGAQELLLHVIPLIAVCVIPLLVGLFLILLPFVSNRPGRPGKVLVFIFLGGTLGLLALTVTGIWFRGPGMILVWPW